MYISKRENICLFTERISMKVVIKDGLQQQYEVNLEAIGKDVISIGRHPDSDIRLNADYISRVHACIYLENGNWKIEDLNSTNGLYYRNQRIKRQSVNDGTDISIYRKGNNASNRTELHFYGHANVSAIKRNNGGSHAARETSPAREQRAGMYGYQPQYANPNPYPYPYPYPQQLGMKWYNFLI